MKNIIDLITQAVAFIFGLKQHNADLLAAKQADATKIKDLEAQLFASSGALEANRATAEAAAAKLKDLEDQAALLDASGVDLAAAITDHPDVPLVVAPDFTATPVEDAPAPEIVTATDKVDAIKAEQAAQEAAVPPVAVDFADGDVVTAGNAPSTDAAPSVDVPVSEEPVPAVPSTTTEE